MLFTPFHPSSPTFQRPGHRLYKNIDWDQVEAGRYAIVDPADPGHILYLTEPDYILQIRVGISNRDKPVVLARPTDSRPAVSSEPNSGSKNSPPGGFRLSRTFLRNLFRSPFNWLPKVIRKYGLTEQVENLVIVAEGNLRPLFVIWAKHLYVKIAGLGCDSEVRRSVGPFASYLVSILKAHGRPALILRLKVYHFCISSFVGGTKLRSTQDVGLRVRLSNGLPLAIPAPVRAAIRRRNLVTIRLWLSLLYIYKSLDSGHKQPDFTGIGDVYIPDEKFKFVYERFSLFCLLQFKQWLFKISGVSKLPNLIPDRLHCAPTAGPNSPNSLTSYPIDTLYWVQRGWDESPLKRFMEAVGSGHHVRMFELYANKVLKLAFGEEEGYKIWRASDDGDPVSWDPKVLARSMPVYAKLYGPRGNQSKEVHPESGRLSLIREAAGKVRVVAIVDSWSQTMLRPLHQFFFKLLKGIGTDGTFDQQGAVSSFADEGHEELYSYDLKAATDTIPYHLYSAVLEPILGKRITSAWIGLLRDRKFLLPSWQEPRRGGGEKVTPLKYKGSRWISYGRGQPMGALSSWGALALLHHAVVQYSAFLVGEFPFSGYRVLGDDIVIAGRAVANSYRETCSHMGIVIGLAKSFCSTEGFFNFANQSYLGQENLSPISFKQELSANSGYTRVALGIQALARKWIDPLSPKSFSQFLRWMYPPITARAIEVSRKKGLLHEGLTVAANLIFQSCLEGVKPFNKMEGLDVITISSRFVDPGLSLLVMGFAAPVVHNKVTCWSSIELLTALCYQQIARVEELLTSRVTELEGLVYNKYGDLYVPKKTPSNSIFKGQTLYWNLDLDRVKIKYPKSIAPGKKDSVPLEPVIPLLELNEMDGILDIQEFIIKIKRHLFFLGRKAAEVDKIVKLELSADYLLNLYSQLLFMEKDSIGQDLSQLGVYNEIEGSKDGVNSLFTSLLLSSSIRELQGLGVKDHIPWISPSLGLTRFDQIVNLEKPENQRLMVGQ